MFFQLRRSEHITDALASQPWLRALEHIEPKISVLAYEVLLGTAPRYLSPHVRVSDLPGRRTLRTASMIDWSCRHLNYPLRAVERAVEHSRLLLHRHWTVCWGTSPTESLFFVAEVRHQLYLFFTIDWKLLLCFANFILTLFPNL